MTEDGKVVIKIESNAKQVASEFANITANTNSYERALKSLTSSQYAFSKGETALANQYRLSEKLSETAKAAQELSGRFKDFSGASNSFKELTIVTNAALERMRTLALQGKINSDEFKELQATVKSNNQALYDARNAVKEATDAYKTGSANVGILRGAIAGLTASITNTGINALHRLGSEVKNFAVNASNVSIQMDGITNTFQAGAYGMIDGGKQMKFVADMAERLGINIRDAYDPYSKFMTAFIRSGGEMQSSKQIFEDISTAIVSLHLNSQQTESIFRALEQMANKGTVQMEELKRQLGNSLPGAFELAAKAMGVTTSQLTKMMSEGKVMSADFLPKFAKVIREELGGSAEYAAQQTNAMRNRVQNDLFKMQDAWGDTFNEIYVATVPLQRSLIQLTTSLGSNTSAMLPTIAQWGVLAGSFATATAAIVAYNAALNTKIATDIRATVSSKGLSVAMLDVGKSAAGAASSFVKAHPIILSFTALVAPSIALAAAWEGCRVASSQLLAQLQQQTIEQSSNYKEINQLIPEYLELSKVTKKTAQEVLRQKDLQEALTNQYPDLIEMLNTEIAKHGELTKEIRKSIAAKWADFETTKIIAAQEEALAKDRANYSKWYLPTFTEDAMYTGSGNPNLIIDTYTKQIAEFGKSMSAFRAGELLSKSSGWSNTPASSDKNKTYLQQLEKQLKAQQDIMARYAAKDDFGAGFKKAEASATALTLRIEKLKQATEIYKNVQDEVSAKLEQNQQEMLKLFNSQGNIVDLTGYKQLRDEANKLLQVQEKIKNATHIETTLYGEETYKLQQLKTALQELITQKVTGNYVSDSAIAKAREEVKVQQEIIDKINQQMEDKFNLESALSSLGSNLTNALTTPLQEGETALQRFGEIARSTFQSIAQEAIRVLAIKPAIEGIKDAFDNMRGVQGTVTGAAAHITKMATDAVTASTGIAAIGTSMTVAAPLMKIAAPAMKSAGGAFQSAAVPAGELAAALTQAAISQAALSVAGIPIIGAVLAPIAATATGAAIGAGNIMASSGMAVSRLAGKFEHGGAFINGNVIPFAKGGVVSSPTYFPMNNGTGLMGEAGEEGIMPLKRMPNGDLGVQAQSQQSNVYVYNYSQTQIETIRRPNNDMEIRIREFDAYLGSDRSNNAFSSAAGRTNYKGLQAA